MAADDLTATGARASADMVLTQCHWNNQGHAQKGLSNGQEESYVLVDVNPLLD